MVTTVLTKKQAQTTTQILPCFVTQMVQRKFDSEQFHEICSISYRTCSIKLFLTARSEPYLTLKVNSVRPYHHHTPLTYYGLTYFNL